MPSLGLSTIATAIETALEAAPDLSCVHITQDLEAIRTLGNLQHIVFKGGMILTDSKPFYLKILKLVDLQT